MPSQEMKERGRYDGTFLGEDGSVCAIGAIAVAYGIPLPDLETDNYAWLEENKGAWAFIKRLLSHLKRNPDNYSDGWAEALWMWNDSEGNSDEVILAGLRAVEEPTMEDLIEPFKEKELARPAAPRDRR